MPLIIEQTVVIKAFCSEDKYHSHCNAGPNIDKSNISIASAAWINCKYYEQLKNIHSHKYKMSINNYSKLNFILPLKK